MRKFKVIHDLSDIFGVKLKIGDIVTLVEGSVDNDLYELPEHLHGKGHDGSVYDPHLNLKAYNYLYLSAFDLVEIKDDEVKVDEYMRDSKKLIRLDITYKPTTLTTRFLVESIRVVDDVLSFRQNGLTHRFYLENYTFRINGNEYFS